MLTCKTSKTHLSIENSLLKSLQAFVEYLFLSLSLFLSQLERHTIIRSSFRNPSFVYSLFLFRFLNHETTPSKGNVISTRICSIWFSFAFSFILYFIWNLFVIFILLIFLFFKVILEISEIPNRFQIIPFGRFELNILDVIYVKVSIYTRGVLWAIVTWR